MAEATSRSASLDAAFLARQKTALEAEQARLEAELGRIAKRDTVGDDYHARFEQIGRHEDENAQEEEGYEASRSVEQSMELELRDVKRALAGIAAGTYGTCARCGELIDQERLTALPSATTCRAHARAR